MLPNVKIKNYKILMAISILNIISELIIIYISTPGWLSNSFMSSDCLDVPVLENISLTYVRAVSVVIFKSYADCSSESP